MKRIILLLSIGVVLIAWLPKPAMADEIVWEYSTGLSIPDDADRLPNGNTLITDTGNNRIIEVTTDGTIVWEYATGINVPKSAHRLTNCNTLIADGYNNRVIEVTTDGTIVWEYSLGDNPLEANRLSNGNTLISVFGGEIIEVDPDGYIVWQTSSSCYTPDDVERLPNGNTLIACDGTLEIDIYGNIVWSCPIGGSNANRLENGNTLIADSGGDFVCEITTDCNIVWLYTGVWEPRDADRLANGNTLITEPYNNRVIEVGPIVIVSVPDTTFGAPGDTIAIPVNTEDLTGLGVLSAEFTLSYDYTIIAGIDVDTSGTLLAGTDWVCDYNVIQGQISVEMAGADTLAGSGTLINLIFVVSPDAVPEQESMLHFYNFMFNQGAPAAVPEHGIFIVISNAIGAIEGIVTDAENGPIEGAVVTACSLLTHRDTTDAIGHYLMPEVLTGTYDMRVTAFGYNELDTTGIVVVEGETTTVNFEMLHPEINVDPMSFSVEVEFGATLDTTIYIANNGNGPLTFNITYYPGRSECTPDIEINPIKNRGYGNAGPGAADLTISSGFTGPIWTQLTNSITWSTVATSPGPSGRSAIGWIGDYVYLFGTENNPYLAQAWQVSNETWVNSTPHPLGGDNWTGVVVNGELYVVGRYDGFSPTTDFYKFTPDGTGTGTWTQLAEYPEPICMLAAAGDEAHGIIYTAGGWNNTGVVDAYKYDIATNIWTPIADLPLPNQLCGGSFLLNGKFYVVGGLNPGDWFYANTLYEYEPSTDTWTTKAPMPYGVGFNWSNVITNGTHIYQVGGGGGYGSWPATNMVQVYEPTNDTWFYETSLPEAFGINSAVYVGADTPYILSTGGWNGTEYTGITFKGTDVITPWLFVNPTLGTIPSGQSLDVSVHFDTYGLTPDSTYTTNILIYNNSADSLVDIPVTMIVITVGFDISGNISYFSDDAPVPNALLEITGDDTYSTTTTTSGDYLFNNIPGGDYISTPSKDDDLGGLSGTDASRIARYAAGLYSLNCLEIIAGDVSLNGSISGLDASKVARYIAGLITELNSNDINWVFTPEPIPDCADWPPIVYESTREYSPLNLDLTDEDFIGIRLGDVSGNWSPGVREPIIYDPSEVTNIETDINSTLRIPIRLGFPMKSGRQVVIEKATAIEGIDISIAFNPEVLQLTELSLQDGILDNKNYAVETNLEKAGKGIMVIYAQKDLVSESGIVAFIEFDIIGEVGNSSEVYFTKFDVNEKNVTGGLQIVDSEGNEIATRRLEVNVVQSLPDKFGLYQNYPNPLDPQTTIFYTLPKSTKVSLSIYNIKGQLVETLVDDFQQPGYYSVVWKSKDVSPGVYLYRITAGDFTDTKKCVILK